MARKMLINAQRAEEVRVAIVNEGILDRYEVSASEYGLIRGNIYRGVVVNVVPSLEAAFVNIGAERDGLLRAEDVVPAAAHRKSGDQRPRIDRLLEKGRPLLVQVTRDGIGDKGCQLTTELSIAGRYLVLMPFDGVRGVSRKVEDEELRHAIRERLDQLDLPSGIGAIARTNAADQPKSALARDLNALLRLWKRIRGEASAGKGPRLLYSDQDLILQVLRDSLDASIDEVLVDSDQAFDKVQAWMRTFMPRSKTSVVRYAERMPLFSRFEVEDQIDRIYQKRVELPSGGSLVIERTEALTAIDVNSGRATRAANQEETAYATDLEAVREVARQLRLRDIGGLVVVDLIDMRSAKHQREVERTLREAMKDDKARFSVGRISANGLLEINRQRIKKELGLRTHRPCPTCTGTGSIASPELVGLNLVRRIETRAVTGRLKAVRVELHPELADAIQNERRDELADLEHEFDIRIEIIAAAGLHRSEERVEWSSRDQNEQRAAPAPMVTVADLAVGIERQAAPAEGPNGADRPKKRRRGGRRRRKAAAVAPAPDNGTAAAVEPAAEDPTPAEPSGAADKPKKRRPRRRRRKKATDPAGGAGE